MMCPNCDETYNTNDWPEGCPECGTMDFSSPESEVSFTDDGLIPWDDDTL